MHGGKPLRKMVATHRSAYEMLAPHGTFDYVDTATASCSSANFSTSFSRFADKSSHRGLNRWLYTGV
jgi:hypothetical protein